MKHSNTYLYGTENVPMIPEKIIHTRLVLLNHQLAKALKVHHTKRNSVKTNALIKAIDFWQNINSKDI